jgi:hypothetical protein
MVFCPHPPPPTFRLLNINHWKCRPYPNARSLTIAIVPASPVYSEIYPNRFPSLNSIRFKNMWVVGVELSYSDKIASFFVKFVQSKCAKVFEMNERIN